MSNFVFTRREFLRSSAIAAMGMAIPSFLARSALSAQTASPAFAPAKDDTILVVLQLGGGNDGLNTVVPFGDDAYRKARRRIGVETSKILQLNDELGLHPSLAPLKELYDGGELAVVNGVGYPNPNRSHFRSMEIWQTASDSDRFLNSGWIGRYFDNCCNGTARPESAIHVGPERPQAFGGKMGVGVSFTDPERFEWQESLHADDQTFRHLNKVGESNDGDSTLDFLRHTTANAVLGSDSIQRALGRSESRATYPQSRIGNALRTVSSLIHGGLGTRIYCVSHTGFDTHANQAGQHERLLGQFAEALNAFQADLRAGGLDERVVTMCFSEFGRRVEENASGGTDHGTAGPMFIAGSRIQPGLHGIYPSLTDLDEGDLKHTVDFRDVYATILEGWLRTDSKLVLGREFNQLGVLQKVAT
ncbi:DUF1501 domain-containing protein [bacterium]|nr:DUF1501 domain-containing protein [bacterium]